MPGPGRHTRWFSFALIAAIVLVIGWQLRPSRRTAEAPRADSPLSIPNVPRPSSSNAAENEADAAESRPPNCRALVLGSWKDQFYGERTMTFRDDGTGDMLIRLDPVSRLLYGPELLFHFTWKLDGDVMHLEMTGGEPKQAAETLSQLFGKKSDRRIEQIDADELRMRSLESDKLYIHKRVTP